MKTRTLALMTALVALSAPQAAFAFDPDRSADVLSRPRPEFDARGVRVGSFMLFPSITGGVAYEDNVFNVADAFAPQEDFLFTLTPELELNSDWGRHALNLYAQSRSYFYQDFSSEDRTDWKVGGDARFDIAGGTNLTVDAMYEELTEPRSTDPAFSNPLFDATEYSHWGVGGALNHASGRFRGSIGAQYDEFNFDDAAGALPAGNTSSNCPNGTVTPVFQGAGVKSCNNDDRDRAVFEAYAKLGYAVSPGYAVFVRGKYNDRDFNSVNPWDFPGAQPPGLEVSDNNRNLDSSGWGADLGIDFELARLLHGEAFIGYLSQEYDAHPFAPALTLPDTDSFAYGVDLKWYPSMLTTVSLGVKRSIEDTTDASTDASGYISDRFNLRVDHELMRNLVFYAHVGFGQDDFQQNVVPSREDSLFMGGLGAVFMINNNLHLTAGYDFVDRDSNVGIFDFTNNSFQLSLTGKL